MVVHFSNKSFMYFLIVQDTLSSNKGSTTQFFVLNKYAEMVFQGIMSDTDVAKVLTAEKSQFKAL